MEGGEGAGPGRRAESDCDWGRDTSRTQLRSALFLKLQTQNVQRKSQALKITGAQSCALDELDLSGRFVCFINFRFINLSFPVLKN